MKHWYFAALAIATALFHSAAAAQPADSAQIAWEVANRFRLFADQKDFDDQFKVFKAAGGTVLAMEQALAQGNGGHGWGGKLRTLCYDDWRGRIVADCNRDGVVEKYLNPVSARIRLTAGLPADFGDASCDWQIATANNVRKQTANCRETIVERAGVLQPSTISVAAKNAAGRTAQGSITVQVRDVLIVGMGDSIASGEGNPMKPVALSDQGFCFRRALDIFSSSKFYLPGRANALVNGDCPNNPSDVDENDRARWDAAAAGWLFNPCHRSLYSYQARVALMLALQNPQITVTFLPLGCTGATIAEGILNSQESRERPVRRGRKIGPVVESQINQLRQYMLVNAQGAPFRPIDLLLLTIGANDIGFSELVANIIVKEDPERSLGLKAGIISGPEDARAEIKDSLKPDFRDLRQALLPLMASSLKKVLYTTYGNPGIFEGGKTCPSSRVGFDGHPAFGVDNGRLTATSKFVTEEFFPTLKDEATCTAASGCTTPDRQAMTFVDGHQTAFADHGFCAKSSDDPSFDKCFKNGDSFEDQDRGLEHPLVCEQAPSSFPTYAKRARWIRTANDSYFAAMTFPTRSGPVSSPSDIHDALWGLESVVYGGAIHPTAEGHAAMADAALSSARALLGLPPP